MGVEYDINDQNFLSLYWLFSYKGKQGEANLYYSRLIATFWDEFALRFEGVLSGKLNQDNVLSSIDSTLNHQQFPKFIWAASFYMNPFSGLELSIDGSSRMRTPSFIQVSPIYIFDENTFTRNIGNTSLKPAFTNSFDFNVNYANKNNKLR